MIIEQEKEICCCVYLQYDIVNRNCLPLRRTWVNTSFLVGFVVLNLWFSVQCFVDRSFFWLFFFLYPLCCQSFVILLLLNVTFVFSDFSYWVNTFRTDTLTAELNHPTFGRCLHILIFKLYIGMSNLIGYTRLSWYSFYIQIRYC